MRIKVITFLFTCLLLCGCSDPLPMDKSDYIGHWQGKQTSMWIQADGAFSYQRVKGSVTTSIDAPIKAFAGDDFEVGALFLTTTFKVTQPPTQTGNTWEMIVDGVTLTRVSD